MLALVLAWASVARAQPPALPAEPPAEPQTASPTAPPIEPQLTAADVAGAPLPGQESGRLGDVEPGDSAARQLGRAVLWIPRVPYELVMQPVRGLVYVQSRFDPIGTIRRWIYFGTSWFVLYPTAEFLTNFGFNLGAQSGLNNVFGRGERIRVRASFGGEFDYRASLRLDTGRRIGRRAAVSMLAEVRSRPKDRFFGFGNGDVVVPAMPIRPLSDEAAVETKFSERVLRGTLELRFTPLTTLFVTVTNAVLRKEFAPGDAVDGLTIDQAFVIADIPRFVDGTQFSYHELEVAWDTRRTGHYYDPAGMISAGGRLGGFAGFAEGLGDRTRFWRLGLDAQRYLRLTVGPRLLELRAYAELVGGETERIPFTELPRLGGPHLLRGYERDRFRDRLAGLVQLGYTWALFDLLSASLFVDVGRVWAGLDDLSLTNPRVGYGFSFAALSRSDLLVRGTVASSIDGGVFVTFSLSSAFEPRSRAERQ